MKGDRNMDLVETMREAEKKGFTRIYCIKNSRVMFREFAKKHARFTYEDIRSNTWYISELDAIDAFGKTEHINDHYVRRVKELDI